MERQTYLQVLWKWRKTLFIIFIISLFLSLILTSSIFIRPLYESSAVCYPINIHEYSTESPTEQMLQLFQSEDIYLKLADSLDLYNYYGIKSNRPKAKEELLKKLNKRIRFKKTQYESVKILVRDESPEFAYVMLQAFIRKYNSHALELLHKRAMQVLKIKETLYFEKLAEVDSLKNLINELIRKHQLMEYSILRESAKGSYVVLQDNIKGGIKDQKLVQASFNLYYLQQILDKELFLLAKLKGEYENALIDTQKYLEFADIVVSPFVPLKKVWPIRSVITVISVFFSVLIGVIIVLIIERIKSKVNF